MTFMTTGLATVDEDYDRWWEEDPDPLSVVYDIEHQKGEDPDRPLRLIALLRRYLQEQEEAWVLEAQICGRPWSHVGRLLGRSKQAVWAKYRDPFEKDAGDD